MLNGSYSRSTVDVALNASMGIILIALVSACGGEPSFADGKGGDGVGGGAAVGQVTEALSLSGGFQIVPDGDPLTLAVNAYGGAYDGGPVKLWANCPTNNSSCMWMYSGGKIISMADPSLAIKTTGVDTSAVYLSSGCSRDSFGVIDPKCLWSWKKGVFHSVYDPSLMINAWGGDYALASLVVNRACAETNTSCRWTLKNVPLLSGADSTLGVHPSGGGFDQNPLVLFQGCGTTPDCTWTFKYGEMFSDAYGLPVWSSGGQGATLKLVGAGCSITNTSCTWTLDGTDRILSDTNNAYAMNAWGGAAHSTPLKLSTGCAATNGDCIFQAAAAPPTLGSPKTLPGTTGQQTVAMGLNENTSLVVPPYAAGCGSNGAVIIGEGNCGGCTPKTMRSDLNCMTTGGSCSHPETLYDSSNWPAVVQAGSYDAAPSYGPTGATDSQLARGGNLLYYLHQGVRRDAGSVGACTTSGTCRGTEYLFVSSNCGGRWDLFAVLDPKTDGPPSNPALCYRTAQQAGHDRPELYVDPYNPGRMYITVQCAGDAGTTRVLYQSTNGGGSWTYVKALPSSIDLSGPSFMTTVSSGTLYIANRFTSGSTLAMGLISYDPGSGTMSPIMNVGGSAKRLLEGTQTLRIASQSEGISRVGHFADGDYVRVHYTFPRVAGGGDIALTNQLVKVSGGAATIVRSAYINAFPGYSVVGARSVETDRQDWVDNLEVNPAIIYWDEVLTVPVQNDFGPAKSRYWALRAADARYGKTGALDGADGCLSLTSAGACRYWSSYINDRGDYRTGSFWFDQQPNGSAVGELNFMALWAEQGTTMSTNFMRLPVWGTP
jgi:hypothetical protein